MGKRGKHTEMDVICCHLKGFNRRTGIPVEMSMGTESAFRKTAGAGGEVEIGAVIWELR
ncbi:hypothetical protein VT98_11523 [Candidatus Electrothrix communis]|uniref:Uncharacterized protein n=1 Tax=Candidatus Electrothrix communis TaxID=1859133 RepID=A0A444J5T0_9BACT|nr:hypothetical protein VT98_11523 [Candidatus Electrothrix communis]